MWWRYLAQTQALRRQHIATSMREPQGRELLYRHGHIDKDGNPILLPPVMMRSGWKFFVEREHEVIERWKRRRAKFRRRQKEHKRSR